MLRLVSLSLPLRPCLPLPIAFRSGLGSPSASVFISVCRTCVLPTTTTTTVTRRPFTTHDTPTSTTTTTTTTTPTPTPTTTPIRKVAPILPTRDPIDPTSTSTSTDSLSSSSSLINGSDTAPGPGPMTPSTFAAKAAALDSVDAELTASMEKRRARRRSRNVFLSGVKTDNTTSRFYRSVGVEQVDNGYALILGNRLVETPANHLFVLPTKRLAMAIAHEWDSQNTHIRPVTMPLTALATTVLDTVLKDPDDWITQFDGHMQFDNICFRADSPASLVRLQNRHWDPLVDWMEAEYGITLNVCEGMNYEGPPAEYQSLMRALLARENPWLLSAAESVASDAQSFIIAWSFLKGHTPAHALYEAMRCDENYQIRTFGHVRGIFGHDVDIDWYQLRIHAARTFIKLLEPEIIPRHIHDKPTTEFIKQVAQRMEVVAERNKDRVGIGLA